MKNHILKKIGKPTLAAITITFLSILTISCGGLMNKEKMYTSNAKVQVKNHPTFDGNALRMMKPIFLSRYSLFPIIKRYSLSKNSEITEEEFDDWKKRINIELTDKSKSVFSISYSDKSPETARNVTAAITAKIVSYEFDSADNKVENEELDSSQNDNEDKTKVELKTEPFLVVFEPANLPPS